MLCHHVYMFTMCMQYPWRPEEVTRPSDTGSCSWFVSCCVGCWEHKTTLQEKQELLTAEHHLPSRVFLHIYFFKNHFTMVLFSWIFCLEYWKSVTYNSVSTSGLTGLCPTLLLESLCLMSHCVLFLPLYGSALSLGHYCFSCFNIFFSFFSAVP